MSDRQVTGWCTNCECGIEASVVMPVYNPGPLLLDQLRSLAEQDTPALWELVISDNGTTDGSLDALRTLADRFHRITVVDSSSKRSPAHARNEGAAAASSSKLLFCDSDDVADGLWVHHMVRALDRSELVAGRLEVSELNSPEVVSWRPELQQTAPPNWLYADYVASCNMACSKSLFARLGGFDESFPKAAGEDVDFAFRARALGVGVEFEPAAIMHYRYRSDFRGSLRQARSYGEGCAMVSRKHHGSVVAMPTARDELGVLYRAAKAAAKRLVLRQPVRPVAWNVAFWVGQNGALARDRRFWSTWSRSDHGRSVRDTARLRRRQLSRMASGPRASAGPRSYNPWHLRDELAANMPEVDRLLLGAGLLSGSGSDLVVSGSQGTFWLNPSLDPIVASVLSSGQYSLDEMAAVEGWLRTEGRGGVIIDVGANIGTTTVFFARRGWRVLSIEPVPRAVQLLEKSIASSGVDSMVTVVPCAIADEAGELEMVAGHNLSTSEIRRTHQPEQLGTPGDTGLDVVSVPARTLSDVLREHGIETADVALVWSDTEGSERTVLEGGRDLWLGGVPAWIEVRPSAIRDHGSLTEFCSAVRRQFDTFLTQEDLTESGPERPITMFRDFVDAVGAERWDFSNALLIPRSAR